MRYEDKHWADNRDYLNRNGEFSHDLGVKAWNRILSEVKGDIYSVLDCGSNLGRNIGFLKDKRLLPNAKFTALDINQGALDILSMSFPDVETECANLIDFKPSSLYDLVFTSGVLIHINPTNLDRVFDVLMASTKQFLVINEYFNRTPVEIKYRGLDGLLWKMDFGSHFQDYSGWEVVSYGFLWGREFDSAGFDDTTYWIFRRK